MTDSISHKTPTFAIRVNPQWRFDNLDGMYAVFVEARLDPARGGVLLMSSNRSSRS
jgi:hypothetical protein